MKKLLTNLHPQIAAQWHPTRNDLSADSITIWSKRKAWWRCENSHEWQAVVCNRAHFGYGCPYCAGQRPTETNCLAATHPHLLTSWHPKNNLKPTEVMGKTNKKVWWICNHGHEWEESVCNRTRPNQGCPYCSGHRVCSSNCFASIHPELVSEWLSDNEIRPEDVTECSNANVQWQCSTCKFIWKTRVSHRSNGHGCPKCRQSKGEQRIERLLVEKGYRFKRQWRFKSCRDKRPLPFDFVVKKEGGVVAIEYQGELHYKAAFGDENLKKTMEHDRAKREWCEQHRLPLLVIPFSEFDRVEVIVSDFIKLPTIQP